MGTQFKLRLKWKRQIKLQMNVYQQIKIYKVKGKVRDTDRKKR